MGKIASFISRMIRGPYKSILETEKPKKVSKATMWAERYYEEENKRNIATRFALVLESTTSVPLDHFTPKTSFLDDIGLDGLDSVEVAMAIEEEFRIPEIEEKDAEKMQFFDDVVNYLLTQNANKPLLDNA